MNKLFLAAAVTLASSPAVAQGHAQHEPKAQSVTPHDAATHEAEVAAVKAVLAQYQAAIERLDATGTEALFAPDSAIFETGGVEGTYSHYLEHHLRPELAEFKVFHFSDYKVDVRFEGPIALATESYKYHIETKAGQTADRLGVATSVLKKIDGQWKILVSHNSGRRPAGA